MNYEALRGSSDGRPRPLRSFLYREISDRWISHSRPIWIPLIAGVFPSFSLLQYLRIEPVVSPNAAAAWLQLT